MSKKKEKPSVAVRQRLARMEKKVDSLTTTVRNQTQVISMLGQAVSIGYNLEKILVAKGIITPEDNTLLGIVNEASKKEDSEPRVDNPEGDNS